jgi:glycosyltransferase involved in cell wall biosynthesis
MKNIYDHDSRIRIMKRPGEKPRGANACRNTGIENAAGDFVAFLDSDDEWQPGHLETSLNLARKTRAFRGCYSGAIIKRGKYPFIEKSRAIRPEETHFDFLLKAGFAPTPSLFITGRRHLKSVLTNSCRGTRTGTFLSGLAGSLIGHIMKPAIS